MKKKVLYTIETRGPGGAETVFLNLIRNMDTNKFLPYVVLRGKGWVYDEVTKSGLSAHIIKSKGSFDIKFLFALRRFIRENKIDIIHSHLFGSNVYSSILGIITGIPVISTFHGIVDVDSNDRYLPLKCMIINKGSKKIVFVSDYLRKELCKKIPLDRKKLHIIHNGIDTSKFMGKCNNGIRTELGFAANDILIGSIGNIRAPKGYDVLIKAAAIIKNKFPQCRFIIVGEGFNALYNKLVDIRIKLGVEDTVRFLGFRFDINSILKSLDIFLLPSTAEGFSISTIEAMAAGIPVIVTDSGGPAEIIKNNENGLVVEPNNPDAIADAIEKYILNKEPKSEMLNQATITVEEKFSITRMINDYACLYKNIF